MSPHFHLRRSYSLTSALICSWTSTSSSQSTMHKAVIRTNLRQTGPWFGLHHFQELRLIQSNRVASLIISLLSSLSKQTRLVRLRTRVRSRFVGPLVSSCFELKVPASSLQPCLSVLLELTSHCLQRVQLLAPDSDAHSSASSLHLRFVEESQDALSVAFCDLGTQT